MIVGDETRDQQWCNSAVTQSVGQKRGADSFHYFVNAFKFISEFFKVLVKCNLLENCSFESDATQES